MPNLSRLTPPSPTAFGGRWVGMILRLGIVGLTTWPVATHAGFFELGFFEQQVAARVVPGRVTVASLDQSSRQGKRLVVLKDGKELGTIDVPPRVSAEALDEGLKGIVQHPNGIDLAAGFKGDKGSFVVVFLRQASESYLAVDVSQVEQKNIGVIGPDRSYRDVHTVPTEWLPDRADGAVQLLLQTRAWDMNGRRYSAKEPLIITRAGTTGWR